MYTFRIASIWILTAALFTVLVGCDEETRNSFSQLAQSAQEMQAGAEELTRSMQEMQTNGDREPVEPVDFRVLRDLIPAQVAGLEETDRGGERNQMGNFTLVNAKADFQGSNRERISIEITDVGGAPGLNMLGLGMMMMEIDRESTSGFERTGTRNGHRMHEKFDTNRGQGEKTVLVQQRFIVKVSGRSTSPERIDEALRGVNIGELERLSASS